MASEAIMRSVSRKVKNTFQPSLAFYVEGCERRTNFPLFEESSHAIKKYFAHPL